MRGSREAHLETRPEARPVHKKKLEFSKAHVIFANVFVAFVFTTSMFLNVFLVINEKPQIDFTLAQLIITVYGGFATCGYFTQNIMRANSLNALKSMHVRHKVLPEDAHYD